MQQKFNQKGTSLNLFLRLSKILTYCTHHSQKHSASDTDLDGLDPKDVLNNFNEFWLATETINPERPESVYKVSWRLHQVFMKTCALLTPLIRYHHHLTSQMFHRLSV